MTKVKGWIREANFVPFLMHLASKVGYALDDGDLDALRFGLAHADTDAAPPRWYEYEFVAERTVNIRLGQDGGTGVVRVELDLPDDVAESVATAMDIMAQYTLRRE